VHNAAQHALAFAMDDAHVKNPLLPAGIKVIPDNIPGILRTKCVKV
jgi:hypothetical protein